MVMPIICLAFSFLVIQYNEKVQTLIHDLFFAAIQYMKSKFPEVLNLYSGNAIFLCCIFVAKEMISIVQVPLL